MVYILCATYKRKRFAALQRFWISFFAALHLFYCVCHALFRIWYFDTAVCWHPNVCNNRLRGIFVYYRNCWKKKGVDCCNFFRYSGYVSTVRSSSDFLWLHPTYGYFCCFYRFILDSRCQSNAAQRKSRRKSKSFSLWPFQFPLHKCKTKCWIDFLGIYNSSNYLLRRVFSTVHKSNCKKFNAIFIAYCSSNRCNLFVAGRNWGIERIFVHDGRRRN